MDKSKSTKTATGAVKPKIGVVKTEIGVVKTETGLCVLVVPALWCPHKPRKECKAMRSFRV